MFRKPEELQDFSIHEQYNRTVSYNRYTSLALLSLTLKRFSNRLSYALEPEP